MMFWAQILTLNLQIFHVHLYSVHIQRHTLDDVFLLTCEDQSQYLVNISTRPVNFLNLPNMVTALANSARYSLIYNNSTATVTIQEVSSQPAAATRTIVLNATVIYDANFGPDDVFAYIATDRGVVFINVDMALNGTVYNITSQLCSQCPPVAFLNINIVVIATSTSDQNVSLIFYQLWPHSSQWLLSRMVNKQPRWYWFPQLTKNPTINTTPKNPTTNNPTANNPTANNPTANNPTTNNPTIATDNLSAFVGTVASTFVICCTVAVVCLIYTKRYVMQ